MLRNFVEQFWVFFETDLARGGAGCGACRVLANWYRKGEGKKARGTKCCRSKVRMIAELKDDSDSDASNKERHALFEKILQPSTSPCRVSTSLGAIFFLVLHFLLQRA